MNVDIARAAQKLAQAVHDHALVTALAHSTDPETKVVARVLAYALATEKTELARQTRELIGREHCGCADS